MPLALTPRATRTLTVAGVALACGYAATAAWAASSAPYAEWSALVGIPLLILVSVPMLLRAGRRDPDPRFLNLLCWAFTLKAGATVARYLMAFVLYDGVADASGYNDEGARLAAEYRAGNFEADIGRPFVGTGFIRVFTGVIYSFTGESIYIAYAVYAWLGFWGLYFLYRAFRVSVPDGNARRYALLLLFLPSMLFWPSGLGKEAFMTFGIGLVAYGSAKLLMGYRSWLLPLGVGLLATGVTRPHVTAALFAGLSVAYLLRRRPRPATELTPMTYTAAACLIALGGYVAVHQAAEFLGVNDVTVSNVDAAITDTAARTSGGGSEYDASGVSHVADFPVAVFSVLYRPLPFEADNAQMMLAATEGLLLVVLTFRFRGSLRELPRRLRRQPYLIVCLVYALIFIYAFSNFSNFGILTRERVQVLPFVLTFLALRAPTPREELTPHHPPTREGTHR